MMRKVDKPNLIFRKAKMARKSVEKYAAKKISVPEIAGVALFGIHSVLEALRANRREFHKVYVKKNIEKRADSDPRIAEILRKCDELNVVNEFLSDDQLDRLTEFQLHNGFCMDASSLKFQDYEPKQLSVFIDRVLDPRNVGAIGRSSWFFGADGISYAKGQGPKSITPSMSKSSCGALEHLPVQRVKDFFEFRENVKDAGGEIVATCDPQSALKIGLKAKTIREWQPHRNVAIVLGDEGIGINEKILDLCDTVVSISPARPDISNVTSLNVSVVAVILIGAAEAAGELCSNGAKPGDSCQLIPSSGYECKGNSSAAKRWCENFNGTHKCCEKAVSVCADKSSHCRLTKHLCESKASFKLMKSKCEYTCGFCNLSTFEEAQLTRNQSFGLFQECEDPRKCVFPSKKLEFNETIAVNLESNTTRVESIKKEFNTTTPKDAITTRSSPLTSSATTYDPNESLKTLATRKREEEKLNITTTSSYEARKVKLEELMTTTDRLPVITTAESTSSLATSLSKTVIRGTCFDEYIYCREFSALCSHPAFSDVMASHCSLTCGRCDEIERIETGKEDCADITLECASYTDLCTNSKYKVLMQKYCPRSCGHCIPMCRDRHKNCKQFAEDGFCEDQMYTKDEIQYLCGATCKLC
ncbi:unnamed protein product [Caenorhabditis bovis]|uniref:rRNA methyltransferase 1, mitochondrial n=1 Tax=Caenorhabditis bovis TaxID=2654633 RepID=A0A8S1EEI0_9PELO|nr:unnamed protein product [Caenorhabditis bovis]